MTTVKNITRISYKKDPEKGERGAIPRVRDWGPGVQYMSGSAGEMYADYTYYDGLYYRCLVAHTSSSASTPYALVQANTGMWTIETNFQMIATKVAFIGEGGSGWIIDGGVIYHSSGKIALNADGSITTQNGKFSVDTEGHVYAEDVDIAGTVNATSGVFRNVTLYGSVRSPFTPIINSFAEQAVDNIYSSNLASHITTTLAWTPEQSGRRMTIVGSVEITAPTGKYFYQDGHTLSTLTTSYEVVELLGFGNTATFGGWIVLNRTLYRTNYGHGRNLCPLAMGTITGTASGASLSNFDTFDGSTLSVTRLSTGKYKLTIPNSWFVRGTAYTLNGLWDYATMDSCLVMATGLGAVLGGTNAIKANVYEKKQILNPSTGAVTSAYVTFDLSDDTTENDGAVMFMIYNSTSWRD